mmetsp:Transcript_87925/g.247008  ORF Transcript_87925/g.247008 Transcript_87925/m.247008 type:complete len:214 (-) Transcript_87925:3-644(-)
MTTCSREMQGHAPIVCPTTTVCARVDQKAHHLQAPILASNVQWREARQRAHVDARTRAEQRLQASHMPGRRSNVQRCETLGGLRVDASCWTPAGGGFQCPSKLLQVASPCGVVEQLVLPTFFGPPLLPGRASRLLQVCGWRLVPEERHGPSILPCDLAALTSVQVPRNEVANVATVHIVAGNAVLAIRITFWGHGKRRRPLTNTICVNGFAST